ncbi:hypothetical protein GALL_106700 [mine drainage metagenome]|uniref:DUF599 domain-containing protein n=1 Tax=mine drainage metagenome TaxID=410659 RepID=A0A1J5SGP5_9ZZZZ
MLDSLFAQVTPLDWTALAWFLVCWMGYGWYAERGARAARGLVGVSHTLRLAWAREMLGREVRIVYSALVGNLMRSVSFYANTTIYIIAALMALWGAMDKAILVTADLPFARETGRTLWESKLLLLIAVFVFSYFKFSWSLRQFNMLSILMGAAPATTETEARRERFAQRLAAVNTLAGDEFNRGIRAYYFGLAALAWFVQPWLFLTVTTLVVAVLYRRDYASHTLAALRDG